MDPSTSVTLNEVGFRGVSLTAILKLWPVGQRQFWFGLTHPGWDPTAICTFPLPNSIALPGTVQLGSLNYNFHSTSSR
jgi:hypothetical protein